MKVLIIGGTGNISTATARTLVARGDEVTLYNRGQRQVDIPGAYKTIIGDRYDHAAFEAQMAQAGTFDCVIDMIGYAPEDVESAVRAFAGRVEQICLLQHGRRLHQAAYGLPGHWGHRAQALPLVSLCLQKGPVRAHPGSGTGARRFCFDHHSPGADLQRQQHSASPARSGPPLVAARAPGQADPDPRRRHLALGGQPSRRRGAGLCRCGGQSQDVRQEL